MGRPSYLVTFEQLDAWPVFTPEAPLRVLTSACIGGIPCGVDGTTYGDHPLVTRLLTLPNVSTARFCPEDEAFGTPRATPDIIGGDGFAVLDGQARFMSDAGDEWTDGILGAARKMTELASSHAVHVAVLMDTSAVCGTSVIYDGLRSLKKYQRGPGVAAAMLSRAGVPLVSQRDERTLARIFEKLGASADGLLGDGLDHHERAWYRTHFPG